VTKKLITIIALTFSIGAWAEEDMISIDDYLNEQTNLDENNLYYVYSRCSAINYKVNGLSKHSEKFKESLADPALLGFEKFYAEAGMVLASISGKNIEEDKENLKATVTGMIDEYTTMSNKLYLKTGSYFTDLMVADLRLCNQLQKDFD
jgi:hypothetical protein